MQLEEQFHVTDRTKLRQWLPWLHLFRTFRIAIGVRALVLGMAAALLIDMGGQLIQKLPFAAEAISLDGSMQSLTRMSSQEYAVHPYSLGVNPVETLQTSAQHGEVVVRPLWTLVVPGSMLFQRGNSWAMTAMAWSHLLWALIVWGVFGVAISRMAAVRFAVDKSVRSRESLRFSLGKLPASVGAPLMPLVGVGCLWLVCLAVGLVGRIPMVGPIVVGVMWWLPMLLATVMTLTLLGLAAGWPLMLNSIGTEDADSFDAFSRAYSYLFSRPWYALWLMILALVYGSLLLTFVATVIKLLMPLATWSVASGMGDEQTRALLLGTGEDGNFATSVVSFWQQVAGLGLVGFVTSYFWTATTVIYFLLRKSVDATPLDAVSERVATTTDGLPIVGVAAVNQREQAPESTDATE